MELKKVEEKVAGIELFGQKKPQDLLRSATELATTVANVINEKKLFVNISGKKFVCCEGWTTMGALLGIFPQVEKVVEERKDNSVKFIARVVVKTPDGRVISAAEAECSSKEQNWNGKEEFTLRSMAQTRATAKALRLPLSWIMVLGGYEPTPAEEMVEEPKVVKVQMDTGKKLITEQERRLLFYGLNEKHIPREVFKKYLKEEFGLESTKDITKDNLKKIWDWIESHD